MHENNWDIIAYEKYLNGDENGLVELVKGYRSALIKYVIAIVHDYHTAEDITEDTFFKIMIKKNAFKRSVSFKAWLYTIAHNLAIDYLRRQQRVELVDFSSELTQEYFTPLQTDIDIEAFQNVYDELPVKYQHLIRLKYIEGFSNHEIATIIKKTPHAVEGMLYRAKAKIKQLMEGADKQ